jgi:hypothetical protein
MRLTKITVKYTYIYIIYIDCYVNETIKISFSLTMGRSNNTTYCENDDDVKLLVLLLPRMQAS